MKITFLGTSHGVQAADRYCQSILVETEKGGYLIDAGAPVMDCLIRLNFDLRKLKAVFITHSHNDHMDGIFGLLSLPLWYYTQMDFDVFLPEQKAIECICGFLQLNGLKPSDRVRLHTVEGRKVYQDGEMAVSAFGTGHMKGRPAYGYLLEAEGKTLYISGDLDGETIDYPAFLEETAVDAFVVECAHFSAERLVKRLENCKARRVIVVHVWPIANYDILRRAAAGLPGDLILPNDGEIVMI